MGPTGAAVAGIKEIGGAVGVGEADAGRSLQEEEVGDGVPSKLVKVKPRSSSINPKWAYLL